MKLIAALLLAGLAGCASPAPYTWVQEESPSRVYRWHQLTSMADIGVPTTYIARTVQYPEGLCVVYSTLSLQAARWWINPRDNYTIADHEIHFHCKGKYHPEKEPTQGEGK